MMMEWWLILLRESYGGEDVQVLVTMGFERKGEMGTQIMRIIKLA